MPLPFAERSRLDEPPPIIERATLDAARETLAAHGPALAVTALLYEIRGALADLISTSRFNRGGAVGPLISTREYPVGLTPVKIHGGAAYPVVVVIEGDGVTPAVNNNTDFLFVATSSSLTRSAGFRYPLSNAGAPGTARPFGLVQGNALQVICDRHQSLYATADVWLIPTIALPQRLGGLCSIKVHISRL